MKELKKQLFSACAKFVQKRVDTVQNIINSNQLALSSETKSSAGDKHETGRAMLQLEIEKASQQLSSINDMKSVLSKISLENSDNVKLGSLVVTNYINYFLAVSAGEINVDGTKYFAVSANSPIGKLLLGKRVGDSFNFNQEFTIETIY